VDWLRQDEKSVWHPYTTLPVQGPQAVFKRAKGAYVYDQADKGYFDATSSWWCQIHGHCHPRLVAALSEQAATLDQVLFAPHTHPKAIELSEQLLRRLGSSFSKIFFSDDGSTAVEVALKMAVQFWQLQGQSNRKTFLSVQEGYHGDTLGAVSVGDIADFHGAFDRVVQPSLKSTIPNCYRCPMGLNYPSCEISCLEKAEQCIEGRGEQIAALIIEPLVMGAAGMITYPQAYLERLMKLCRKRGILVIFDEVFTGFGRTGTLFALDQLSEKPDIVCLSKGLTSGMLPLAVTAVTNKIFEPFIGGVERTFYHGHTYTGNALGCAVALESLRLFEEEKVLERNEPLIRCMQEQRGRFLDLPHVGDVRHLGMIWAVELVKDKKSREIWKFSNGPGWSIAKALWEQGIWMRPLHNTLYLVPPYCTSPAELAHCFGLLYAQLQYERHYDEQRHIASVSD